MNHLYREEVPPSFDNPFSTFNDADFLPSELAFMMDELRNLSPQSSEAPL